jgi:hypothetical protein
MLVIRIALVAFSTLIIPINRMIIGDDALEDQLHTVFTKQWYEILSENPQFLSVEQNVIELAVWQWTERFLFFPTYRRRIAARLTKHALKKWRWERAMKGLK